ncbi:hypothetical protein [Paractinoplanes brasiliensis]|uniref:Uncharacterized protein n=1 Tax=Paractinoplanes brasiliensis TaxID=52695 RepID=A0A4R6JUQ3_9ACTN|nr:hypothetical protein [Actinoplanes brasiliensis]TDO40444.1 hypothetical protein C8E87_4158 [Actinoplanes brasiliensis]GID25512.1 hypothetical protein Abr02nite_04950 [Actinoplanes brasiliensis]
MTETRYRRLLALYPRAFVREYGDEMVGVLMADRRPGVAQGFDLVRGAVAAHLSLLFAGQSRVARTVQIFGALLLFAVALRRVVPELWVALEHPSYASVAPVSLARMAGWGVALIGAYLGWRLLGVAGATVGLAGEIAAPARFYLDTPATLLHAYWLIVAAVVVLIAALTAERGEAEPRGLPWVAAAGTVLVAEGTLFPRWLSPVGTVLVLIAAALVAVAVLWQDRATRTRLLCWAAPVVATVPLVQWGFSGLVEYNMRNPESTQLINPLQWAVLVLVPLVAFAGASVLSRRDFERLAAARR